MSKKFGKSHSSPLKNSGSNDKATLADLEAQYLNKRAADEASQVQIKEQRTWSMRWKFICIMVFWVVLGLAASITLFIITRNSLSFIPLTGAIYSSPQILSTISRFLFWGPEDYKLEEMKLIYKQRQQEAKYRYKYHYDEKKNSADS